jgi:MFS family permease
VKPARETPPAPAGATRHVAGAAAPPAPMASGAGTSVVLAATTGAQIASIMGVAVFPVIAPTLAADIGVAPALIGYQVSLIYGAAAIGGPLLNFTVPRWGACRTTQFGLALCALAMALALVASLPALALASVLLGLGMTVMTAASAHLLFRFSPPQRRNLIFSLKQTGVPLGWMIMALVAPALALAYDWRAALVPVIVLPLALALALQRVRSRWDDDRGELAGGRMSPRAGIELTWRTPALRWLSLAALCLTFVQLSLATFAVTMLVAEAGYSLVAAGVMLSLVQIAGAAGRVAWGWIADRTGDTLRVLRALALATAVCCAITVALSPAWPTFLLALFFILFGAAAVGWNGLFLAEVARCSPRGMVSVATGAAMMWNFGGVLLGPAMFAAAYGVVGSYTSNFALLALVALAGFVLFSRASRAAHSGKA